MDWIEFVSKHSGSPFSSKMRHHNILDWNLEQKLSEKASQATGIFTRWLSETDKQTRLQTILRIKQIDKVLAASVQK